MKVVLIAGPGGAGCSTVSLAAALRMARTPDDAQRAPVVLVSSSIRLPADDVAPVEVIRPDARGFVEQHLPDSAKQGIHPSEIAGLPGVDLLATLGVLGEVLHRGPQTRLVVDAGAQAVALVGIVERLTRLADGLVPPALRLLGRMTGRAGASALGVWDVLLEAVMPAATVLTGGDASAIFVLPEDPGRVRDTERMIAQLALFGVPTGAIVARSAQVSPTVQVPVTVLPWSRSDPTVEVLAALPRIEQASRLPIDPLPEPTDEGTYRWALPLPGARRDELDLERDEETVLLSVGDVVRRLDLPSVLQRCEIAGARFDDGLLTITFRPDPTRWSAVLRQPVAAGGEQR